MAVDYDDPYDPDGESDEMPSIPPDAPPPSAPDDPAERRRKIGLEIVTPAYRDILGRDPSADEVESGISEYERYGGDALRSNLRSRLSAPPQSSSSASREPYPRFQPPPFDYPEFDAPDAFEYDAYEPLTAETFKADPGYEWRVAEGDRAQKNFAASQGLLRTGGTLKDLLSWREGMAAQEFGNVDARRFRDWRANYDLRRDGYERDWRSALTNYTLDYTREADEYARSLSTYGVNLDAHNSQFSNLLNLYNLSTRNLPSYTPPPMPQY